MTEEKIIELIEQWLGLVYQFLRWLGFSEAWHFGVAFVVSTVCFVVAVKKTTQKPAVTLNPSEIDAVRDAKSKGGLAGIIAAFKAGEQVGKRNNKGE